MVIFLVSSNNLKPTILLFFLVVLVVAVFFNDDGFAEALVSSAPTISTSTINDKIHVSPVSSAKDLVDLGNLRYSEWMLDLDPKDRPSRMAFRMATAECQQERMEQNAVAFLARSSTPTSKNEAPAASDDGEVIGTAELSCIELKDCYYNDDDDGNGGGGSPESISHYFYVTDVVTARTHRRQGVAATLMDALEQHALSSSRGSSGEENQSPPPVLLLHVEHDNKSALAFYKALGYEIVDDNDHGRDNNNNNKLEGLNVDRLSENAGVSGQLLLSKTLEIGKAAVAITTTSTASARKSKKKKKSRNTSGGGFGFGK